MGRQVRNVTQEESLDPEVRAAVLKLFKANEEFRQAYASWVSSPSREAAAKLRAVGEAESHIDAARHEVAEAEQKARAHFEPIEKSFSPRLP